MLSKELEFTLNQAFKSAREKQHEFMTIEHLLLALIDDEDGAQVMAACGVDLAELGEVVEKHLTEIGLLKAPELDEHRKRLIAEKRAEFEAESRQQDAFAENTYPDGAQLCTKCSTAAVVMMDGCMTCLNCGDSKCG